MPVSIDDPTPPPAPPPLNSAVFSDPTTVDNRFFPLSPGKITSFEASFVDPESGQEESERNDVFVSHETKSIVGVETVVVRDTAFEDGVLVEDTLDWYAQDDAGNVWYFGEIVINYNYDDEGDFVGTDFDGSFETGVDGALPGHIMEAAPKVGDSYFQEFYEGVAQDVGTIVAAGLTVRTEFGTYRNILKILDSSPLEPGVGAFKYFAPGVGQITEDEILFEAADEPLLTADLVNVRDAPLNGGVEDDDLFFKGEGARMNVTFLTEDGSANTAIGAYTYDVASGVIGEARILFANTEDERAGASASVFVAKGRALGLFMVPDVEETGLDLEEIADGGLFFRNFAAGDVAFLFDGDPATTYAPGPATVNDTLAPVVTNAEGEILPIRAFHTVGERDGQKGPGSDGAFNFLNPVAGINAEENAALSDLADDVTVVGFEDALATVEDYDADFDDALVAVSEAPLAARDVARLVDATGISRIVGGGGRDRLNGTRDDDQLIGLDGDDVIRGRQGDDVLELGDGDDRGFGGHGSDEIDGEDGDDLIFGRHGRDELSGGEGDDRLSGGRGHDLIEGDEGADRLLGSLGRDELRGGEDDDILRGGRGADKLTGGEGDDTLHGGRGPDVFLFDLIEFGYDAIADFGTGADRIAVADYLDVSSLADIEITQAGRHTVLAFADGTVTLRNFDADDLSGDDFLFG